MEKIKDTLEHKEELVHKLRKLRDSSEQVLSSLEEKNNTKKRRHRRAAKDIERHFNCPILKCDKSYGSEGSLNQHIKQKHRKYWNKHCCGDVKDKLTEGVMMMYDDNENEFRGSEVMDDEKKSGMIDRCDAESRG